jgi:hypothetical protein
MRVLNDYARVKRLIDNAIVDFNLNLQGITVLTETASGPYVVTPLIAAMAGAEKVVAVTRSSRYGSANDVKKYTQDWIEQLGLSNSNIEVSLEPAIIHAETANLVTNLGFVRPINADFIKLLPHDAAISLMWETWEFRESDLDLPACIRYGVPVLGTFERHPRLQTFRYVGLCALKLLLEANIEVLHSKVLVLGSGYFGEEVAYALKQNGANVMHIKYPQNIEVDQSFQSFLEGADACIICEHHSEFPVIGKEAGIPSSWFENTDLVLIHICGNFDLEGISNNQIKFSPGKIAPPGFMSVATDYVGPRPVIDLHAAGLKVGQELIKGKRMFGNAQQAKLFALANSPAMDFIEE